MRIIAGKYKGRALATPADRTIRPSSIRLRTALFDMLAHRLEPGPDGPAPRGLAVLDAFAGSGALGIEAISRGAAFVTFLEQDGAALALIRDQIARLDDDDRARCAVVRADALAPPPAPPSPAPAHEIALLDPPYGKNLAAPALAALRRASWLAPGAAIAVELGRRADFTPPPDAEALRERRHGAGRLLLLRLGG